MRPGETTPTWSEPNPLTRIARRVFYAWESKRLGTLAERRAAYENFASVAGIIFSQRGKRTYFDTAGRPYLMATSGQQRLTLTQQAEKARTVYKLEQTVVVNGMLQSIIDYTTDGFTASKTSISVDGPYGQPKFNGQIWGATEANQLAENLEAIFGSPPEATNAS